MSQHNLDLSQNIFSRASTTILTTAPNLKQRRNPLGTLSLSSLKDDDSDEVEERAVSLQRLRKRVTNEENQGLQKQQNAFTLMLERTKQGTLGGKETKRKAKGIVDLGNFVMDEAEESDEEAQFGFGNMSERGEEGDENLDEVVEGLLDDAEMAVDVENQDKVMEKYQ